MSNPLQYGKQSTLQSLTSLESGVHNYTLTLDSSACILSLYVPSLSGTVDCRVYTRTNIGQELLKDSFTQISSPTPELVLLRVNDVMGELRIELDLDSTAQVELKARAVHSVADSATATITRGVKEEVLAATDLITTINYADLNTCDERITSVEYNSASVIPTQTLTKMFNYTLNSGIYTLTSITWTLA
jgi:hypothetical protein